MQMNDVAERGIVLLGCGKMGSAMLAGWLAGGLPRGSVWVRDPTPSDWVRARGVHVNDPLPANPAVVLIAVKPQMMGDALPAMAALGGGGTLFISVAAGTSLAQLERVLGANAPVIRAMPNTPAAIGQGITAIVGNDRVQPAELELADQLLQAIGQVVRLDHEAQIDAVTGLSGSGPAYVFHMIETMAAAGEAQGLPAALAMKLAVATVGGAGVLARQAEDTPAQLRINVTSPNGTTQAALDVLMDPQEGLAPLMQRAVDAATRRAQELGNG